MLQPNDSDSNRYFVNIDDVDSWAAKYGGEQGVRDLLVDGRWQGFMNGMSRTVASEWLQRLDDKRQEVKDAEARDLAERATAAAEYSAQVAAKSAKWAGWACVIAVAALALSAWPYIK